MTVYTRRDRKPAAHPTSWQNQAACRGQDTEDFFTDSRSEQNRARAHCRACPVIATCLWDADAIEDGAFRFGVSGGLSAEQRRAFKWEVMLHGRPDTDMARRLVSDGWRPVLHGLRLASVPAATAELRDRGLKVGSSTVRLAMWWLGYRAPRIPDRPVGEPPELMFQRVIDMAGSEVVRLRALNLTFKEIGAYLGVGLEHVAKAIRVIEVQQGLEVAA